MKRKFLAVMALVLTVAVAQAQEVKIGFTNIDAIVFSMPEIPGINSELETYQQQLGSQVGTKRNDIQVKLQALQQMAQQPNADQMVLQEKQNELMRLQEEFETFSLQAEQAFNKKQADLLNPIYEKVGAAIEAVRKEGGFMMILNSQMAQGGNIVLAAGEELNITEKVFAKLGVPMPQAPADGGAANNGN